MGSVVGWRWREVVCTIVTALPGLEGDDFAVTVCQRHARLPRVVMRTHRGIFAHLLLRLYACEVDAAGRREGGAREADACLLRASITCKYYQTNHHFAHIK